MKRPRIAAVIVAALALAEPPVAAVAQGLPTSPTRPSGPTILPYPYPRPPAGFPSPRAPVPGGDRSSGRWGISYQFVPYYGAYGVRLTRSPTPNSPAATLQLEPGDMIVRLDNQPLYRPEDLDAHVARTDVVFVNIRTGRPQSGVVYLPGRDPGPFPPTPGPYRLGIATVPAIVEPPRPGLPRQPGLRVTTVEPGSPAERAGLRPGDAIVRANRRPASDEAAFRRIIAESGGALDLLVVRRGYPSGLSLVADLRQPVPGPIVFSEPGAGPTSPTPPPPPPDGLGSPLANPTHP